MRAFVSYRFGDNISNILSLLHDKHIDVFDNLTDLQVGTSFQQAIKDSIAAADFILLVYTQPNTNLSFEAGVALGLGKPIFSILSPQIEPQDFLFDSTYVYCSPQETSKIDFSLTLFINNLKPKKSQLPSSRTYFGGGVPHPSDYFYNKFLQLKNRDEKSYESLFKEIFDSYQLNVVANVGSTEIGPDFSIWNDNLTNVLTNPILVQLVKKLTRAKLRTLEDWFHDTLAKNPTSSFLIFYDDLSGVVKKELPSNPKCFYIQIADFMSYLRETGFNEAISKIRNQVVHKLY